ncbi:integral membrane protein [Patellaria atrata CBS 101060]|uniref:Integral membrane protein n=1 Tax=Patellaria atrata CBS 101060 TaxID=1346257 RepID=A0A9P4S3W6_9PEZI|nr:integral membrane protein [Patellaria atrata CBS 101060]
MSRTSVQLELEPIQPLSVLDHTTVTGSDKATATNRYDPAPQLTLGPGLGVEGGAGSSGAAFAPPDDSSQRSLAESTDPSVVGRDSNINKKDTASVITSVTCVTLISSMLAGLVTVALPPIAEDIELADNLLLWPASVYSLTCGCTLLLLGSISDVVGCRIMYLIGCALQSVFTLASGLARNGNEFIAFRALAGIAISFCLPSAVSIITNTFPTGKRRNIAFASMGGGQPIGFSVGLTMGGVFADTVGWRWGFYVAAILNTVILILAIWGLPRNIDRHREPATWERLVWDIDWIGAMIASASLAMMSYVFASVTAAASAISAPINIAFLALSLVLIPVFIFWVGRQEGLGRPAIIPNSLWRNRVFSTICISVFLTWGAFNLIENITTLFFQYVQEISAIQTSLRFLPGPVSGALTNVVMGLIVHKIRADRCVTIGTTLSCGAALLMAVINPAWPYWACAFPSIFLNPIGADCLFTISNLLITSVFPAKTQGLAGGVFNTVAQIGKSVGLATSAVLAASITARSAHEHKESPDALMDGYRATYWYGLALTAATLALCVWGLRGAGKVGEKRD